MQRVKDKIGALMTSSTAAPWPQVRVRLNRLLAGWSAYFSYGTRASAYRAVDHHVYDRVRRLLARRHKEPGRGTRRFTWSEIQGHSASHPWPSPNRAPPPWAFREVCRKAGCGTSARPV